jgi:ABC-type Fe3+/spermidine/putrescine transport system ATPase subunit
VGTPREIYSHPASRFVAEFMGVGNLWDGVVPDDGRSMQLPDIGTVRLAATAAPGAAVYGIRAERIKIGAIPGSNQMTGVLERTIYAGEIVTHRIRVGSSTIVHVTEPAHATVARDGEVTLSFSPHAGMVFPR